MNLLAHQLLSQDHPQIALGNFIADAIKGSKYKDYPKFVQVGILLHRKIDFFMDHHEIPLEGMKRLRAEFGKYSTVIIDVIYDHFLAKNWKVFHPIPLEKFTVQQYEIIDDQNNLIPDRLKEMFHYMKKMDWLSSYQNVEGIQWSLEGMSRRIKHNVPLYNAVQTMLDHYTEYDNEVKEFIPIVQRSSIEWTEEIIASIS